MLCNEFDLGFILESVKKTIMVFFFGCFRVEDENQNHHIISDSFNKKNPLVSRNRLVALLLSESQGDEDDYELLRDNNVGFHRPAPVHDRKEDGLCCCGRDGSNQLVMDGSEMKQMVVTMASFNGLHEGKVSVILEGCELMSDLNVTGK
ncbi:hypothetical protein C5167_031003 [Papaver somniferum]|nr:hypothetical protein C5167_031003 [Papaver somniferum]